MRRVVCTFSGKAYNVTTAIIEQCSLSGKWGANDVLVFDDKWLLSTDYYRVNRWLFDAKSCIHGEGNSGAVYQHGFGWCSWKSFVIQSAWDRMQDGDIVLYLDADTYPVAPFGMLFDQCADEGGVMLFEEQASNLRFTKRGCRLVMGIPDGDGPHACGRFSLWQKGSFIARQMLAEWWAYSINRECTLWDGSRLTDLGGNACGDPPEYYRHSTEQSVLSNLAIKYGIPLHRAPDQGGYPLVPGAKDAELYPVQLFEQKWCEGDRSDLSGSSYRNV